MESPRTPNGADVKRAAATAEADQRKFGAKESSPSLALLALSLLRVIIAGAVAGAWDKFGGLGTQLANSAEVMEAAMITNQETALKLAHGQKQEWQQLAGGRRDVNQIEMMSSQPNQLFLSRAASSRTRGKGMDFSDEMVIREGERPR